ncbi:hypothetical protein BH11BAC5_BH11BAC5_51700 [soil metagenome]
MEPFGHYRQLLVIFKIRSIHIWLLCFAHTVPTEQESHSMNNFQPIYCSDGTEDA